MKVACLKGTMALLVMASCSVQPAEAQVGWRGDGTGRFPHADPPTRWSSTQNVRWVTPMPAWSNASPVVAGKLVFVCAEPTTLIAVDADTGVIRWTRKNEVVDALPKAEREIAKKESTKAEQLAKELEEGQRKLNRLRREARRKTTGSDVKQQVVALANELDQKKALYDTSDRFRTPPDRDIIGYASATPLTVDKRVFAHFGNGVVTCYNFDGSRRWSRWLGEMPRNMNGFDVGSAASPMLAGGVLVVANDHLYGLDPETGTTLWKVGPYRDYGTPAIARIAGEDVLMTPGGQTIRARDGLNLRDGLASIWYTGPSIGQDQVYFVGGNSERMMKKQGHTPAVAYALAQVSQPKTEPKWRAELAPDAYYTAAVEHGGYLHCISKSGHMSVVNAETGKVALSEALPVQIGDFFPSPVVAGDLLYLGIDTGETLVLKTGPALKVVARNHLEETRSTPFFAGNRMYVRGLKNLYCIED